MFQMVHASYAHQLVVANPIGELSQQLRSRSCDVVPLDRRVRAGSGLLSAASRAEDSLVVESLGVRLTLADLYEKVEFGVFPVVGI